MYNRLVARFGGAACVLSFFFFLVHFSVLHAGFERFTRLRPSTSSDNADGPTEGSRDSQIGNQIARPPSTSTITRPEVIKPDHGGPNIESPTRPSPASTSISVDTTTRGSPLGSAPEDKIVVIGKLQHENTDWVAEFLPEWQHAIYTVDNTSHLLHTDANKGREANAYLSYILRNYESLPSIVSFVHPHRDGYPAAWHNDASNYDNVNSLKALNIDFVQRNGYANLRCIWIPGCPDEIHPLREPPKDVDGGESTEQAMASVWPLFFAPQAVPSIIGTPCCAQFAVSRDQIRKRPLLEYVRYHDWLMKTELSDDVSGRVFEYLWHIIFGQDPIYCPELQQCYHDVYGGNH